jgi:hypothetical protein
MNFTPRRTLGTLIGAALLLVLMAAAGAGLSRLNVSPVTPLIILWVLLPLISLPLMVVVGYRLYGLWTAAYRIDREGFYLRWGLAREQIPLGQVESVRLLGDMDAAPRPAFGWWWPGCVVTKTEGGAQPPIEIFAGSGLGQGALIVSSQSQLLIAPADPQGFVKCFTEATRLGSLEPIAAHSERPAFVFTDVWADRRARTLILVGAALPFALLAFVGWRAPGMPSTVPFGFDAFGNPGAEAPPGRLLLLPFMAGVLWLVDLSLGAWLYRSEDDRRLAYTVWTIALAAGLLLWGAVLHLMSNA